MWEKKGNRKGTKVRRRKSKKEKARAGKYPLDLLPREIFLATTNAKKSMLLYTKSFSFWGTCLQDTLTSRPLT